MSDEEYDDELDVYVEFDTCCGWMIALLASDRSNATPVGCDDA